MASVFSSIAVGSRIHSHTTCYTVKSVLGQGSYGKVVECVRGDNGQRVALKLMEDSEPIQQSAATEITILRSLQKLDVPQANWVKFHDFFQYRDCICLEFEQLDKSLMDLLVQDHPYRLSLPAVRAVVQQVATALDYFKSAGVIHIDLKPDNVMLVDHKSQPFKVKVIDFGLAQHVSWAEEEDGVGTLPYTAPEALLEAPYNEAVDVWSLGCMAAYLLTSQFLFPGWDESDILQSIERSLGRLPRHLIRAGGVSASTWRKKMRFGAEMTPSLTLDDLLNVRFRGSPEEQTAMAAHMGLFVDLLRGMLQLDPARRLTPSQILQHPFLTMDHELLQDQRNEYIRECHEIMAVCCPETKPPAKKTTDVQQKKLSERPAPPASSCSKRKVAAGVQGRRDRGKPRGKKRSPERDRDRSRSPRDRRTSSGCARTRPRPSPDRRAPAQRQQPTQRVSRRSPERNRDRSRSPCDRRTSSQRQTASRATTRQPGCARARPRPSPDRRGPAQRQQPTQRVSRRSPQRNRDRSRSPRDRRTSSGCARTRPRPSPDRRAPTQRRPTQRVDEGSPKCRRDRSRSPHRRRMA